MIISRAPVRVSFFGGGTDYPEYFREEGGAVLASAIDKYCYLTASPFLSHLFDYSIRVSYRKVELARRPEDIEHRVYRECLKRCGLHKDIELHAMADLPAFTGLGSSSTFTVALLHALHSFRGEFRAPFDLACEAIEIERHVLREHVGCQDQVLAAYGGFNVVEFRAEDDFQVQRVALSPARLEELEAHLVLVFTGITRQASSVVAEQLKKVQVNKPLLRRMRAMVDQGYALLTGGQSLAAFGELLHQAWQAKRDLDDGISSAAIDAVYERGRAAGAWGGKLLGAGGGGFLLFCAPPEAQSKLAAALAPQVTLRVRLGAPGSQIIFASPSPRP
jgi:D-glycero-alpha-D-manno-heptose-7-phosphate kinase